MNTMFASQPGL